MKEYSIHISNGKVVGDSTFFLFANALLREECKRLCDFTDALEKDPAQKKSRIAEYKCAKYRYAGVSAIHCLLQMNNSHRQKRNLEDTHYLLLHFDEVFRERSDYFSLYEAAPPDEKPDFSLYYGLLAVAEKELGEMEPKLPRATDWEQIELEERIGGWRYAIECLSDAWQRRKEVIA